MGESGRILTTLLEHAEQTYTPNFGVRVLRQGQNQEPADTAQNFKNNLHVAPLVDSLHNITLKVNCQVFHSFFHA